MIYPAPAAVEEQMPAQKTTIPFNQVTIRGIEGADNIGVRGRVIKL